jgi:hypothetical protein
LLAYVKEKTVVTRDMVNSSIADIQGNRKTKHLPISSALIRSASMTLLLIILVIAAGFAGFNFQNEIRDTFGRKPDQTSTKTGIVVAPKVQPKERPSLFLDERKSLALLFGLYEQEKKDGREDHAYSPSLVTLDMPPEYFLMLKRTFRVNVRENDSVQGAGKYLLARRVEEAGAVVIDSSGEERVVDKAFFMSCWGGEVSWIYPGKKNIYLVRGMEGAEVLPVQQMFREIGYEIELNGRFDEKMRRGVIQFQNDFDLKVDGIIGPKTYALLYQMTEANEHD